MKCRDTQRRISECRNAEMNARSHGINPTVQVNLKKIGGLLLHATVKLLETIDGFYQRMRRDFGEISIGDEESHGICQWNEDNSWRKLTVG
jgi:hypothetical protein